MDQLIIVENLKCSGCVESIKKRLSKIDGVHAVAAELQGAIVKVEGEAERHVLLEALASMGYPEKRSNSLSKKMISYVSCAVGKLSEQD